MAESISAVAGANLQYGVYLGYWTNWSRGPIFGATVTVTRDNGNLLIAFTAFFVSIVSSRFWRIACLLFHRCYSTPKPRDAFHHQRQAILRNSANPETGLWGFGQMCWAWRRSAKRVLLRSLPTLLSAVLCVFAFAAASGFSSRISTAISNEVLIDGSNCGFIVPPGQGTVLSAEEVSMSTAYSSAQTSNAVNYAQQCYSDNVTGSGIFDCASLTVNRIIPVTLNREAPCPFKNGICRSDTSNLLLDTGYIDSHEHLGINSPPDERILYRYIYHCAPLHTEGYAGNTIGQNDNYTRYYYGPAVRGAASKQTVNYTFEAETLSAQYSRQIDNFQRNRGANFILVNQLSTYHNGSWDKSQSGYKAIPSLDRPDGHSNIVFLVGNGVAFEMESNDPWYRATVPGPSISYLAFNGSHTSYQPSEAASPLGCFEQFQLCNAALPLDTGCGPLAAFQDALEGAAPRFNLAPEAFQIGQNTSDDRIASRYLWFANNLSMSSGIAAQTLDVQGAKALLSQQTLRDGFQCPLGDDQWKDDVTYWWSATVASVQLAFINAATGPHDPTLDRLRLNPGDAYQRDMCSNQKVRTTNYTSFSVFGLYFVFATGSFIILLSYTLEPLMSCLDKRRNPLQYKRLEWKANDTLYLQGLGFQGLGRGHWSGFTHAVPVTKPGELFESLAFVHDPGDRTSEKNPESAVRLSLDHTLEPTATTPSVGNTLKPHSTNEDVTQDEQVATKLSSRRNTF